MAEILLLKKLKILKMTQRQVNFNKQDSLGKALENSLYQTFMI